MEPVSFKRWCEDHGRRWVGSKSKAEFDHNIGGYMEYRRAHALLCTYVAEPGNDFGPAGQDRLLRRLDGGQTDGTLYCVLRMMALPEPMRPVDALSDMGLLDG